MSKLMPLAEAQARLLELAPTSTSTLVETEQALGRYLARDLVAKRTQPAADLSAMDGYAICGDGPWQLVGESRAGSPFEQALSPGQCVRVSTGALMPAASDRVVIQESAETAGASVTTHELPPPERHVRKRGFDFSAGDTVLTRRSLIGPAQIALALSSGHAKLEVAAPPAVVVMDSGDELVADPDACGDHQIPASNGAMLAAMLRPLVGASVHRLGPIRDDLAALADAFGEVDRSGASIVITSGGASVGDHDLIKPALLDWGAELAFWKVAMKPGKPVMVATRSAPHGPQLVLGLPGNPVSSFVTCFLFALPLIRAAMGAKAPLPATLDVEAGEPFAAIGSRQEFLRGVTDGRSVTRASSQDSSALAALATANCLIDRPANSPAITPGEKVTVYPLLSDGAAHTIA